MDIKYGSPEAKTFVTNLSLITSKGKWGDNVMTAEWVHQVSYEPGIIMVNIHDFDATADNIIESKEFGVSVLAQDQADAISIAGGSSGKQVDKIAVLKESGFSFYQGKKIGVQMLKGASLNIECKLLKHEKVGDHMMFIGEVADISLNQGKEAVVFRAATGIYKLGEPCGHKQEPDAKAKLEALVTKHKRPS